MFYYEVAPLKIARVDSDSFTYSYEDSLEVGQIVVVELGSQMVTGIVVKKVKKPSFKTKSIQSTIEQLPLPSQLVDLAIWMGEYYNSPLANVFSTIIPSGIKKKRRQRDIGSPLSVRNRINILLNREQGDVLRQVAKFGPGTYLLNGITGSGKTAVYIELAKQTIDSGKSVIMMVPEISLTPQLVSEFSNSFADVIVSHSKMTESSRHLTWKTALNQDKPMVIIGPRSTLFTPFSNLGLIIVDEAHEPSYKQEQSPRYSAIRAASVLGKLHGATVLLGSATPSVVDSYLAGRSSMPILKLTQKAVSGTLKPSISIVDMTKLDNFSHRFISKQLINQIEQTLAEGKQTLIFHNRRGSANVTICNKCGWYAECPRCFIPLTLHADYHALNCHVCGYSATVPTSCPKCHGTDIIHKGVGTKVIETELTKLFPKARIARFDADNKADEALDKQYTDLYDGKIDIAIGTQIVAKGLDLPHLRTVGVIQADTGLAMPDYSTNERTFQLLSQVVGRVGRNEHQTNVIIQTYQPSHPSIIYGVNQDYESFYSHTLNEREKGNYPPFVHLAKVVCSYKTERAAVKSSRDLAATINGKFGANIQVLGPTPAFYERLGDNYRWQIVLKSKKRQYLQQALKLVPKQHWQSELDPTSLL